MIDLSPCQQQMLDLIARGYPNKEIARELNLGLGTVKVHVTALFLKLGVHCHAGAVARRLCGRQAIDQGWRRFAQYYWNARFRGQVKFLTRNEKLVWIGGR
jgi:DNA-binding CsgD family transcriptional regulator